MKLTHEKLAALKALKMPDWLARKDDPWAHEAARAIPALIAELEEAQAQLRSNAHRANADITSLEQKLFERSKELSATRKQLAEAQALLFNISEDTPCKCNEHSKQADEFLNRTGHKALDSILDAAIAEAIKPYRKDAERYRWLTNDHDSPDTRKACHDISARIPVMSYSAASQAIDAAIAAKVKNE